MKMVATVISAVAMLAAGSASAQSFSPSTGTFNGSGNVDLLNSANVNCDVSFSGTLSSSTVGNITTRTLSPGDAVCGWGVSPYSTWSMTTISGVTNKVVIYLGATTLLGSRCKGWVEADVLNLGNGTSKVTFFNDQLQDAVYPSLNPTGCYVVDGSVIVDRIIV